MGATSSDDEALGAYAVRRADGRLFVLLLNRATDALDVTVGVAAPLVPGPADLFRFDGATPLGPASTVSATTAGFTLALPPRSATLAVVQLDIGLVFADGFESGDASAWSATAE